MSLSRRPEGAVFAEVKSLQLTIHAISKLK